MLTRHSPVIWNVGYWNNAFYWDGRAKTLEENAKGAWGGGNMGAAAGANPRRSPPRSTRRPPSSRAIAGYKPLFEAAFGDRRSRPSTSTGALAEYMRTMVCNDTAYDQFAAGDKTALTEQQQRGLDIFLGKGSARTCHTPPYFSTAMGVEGGVYFNVGIGTAGAPRTRSTSAA